MSSRVRNVKGRRQRSSRGVTNQIRALGLSRSGYYLAKSSQWDPPAHIPFPPVHQRIRVESRILASSVFFSFSDIISRSKLGTIYSHGRLYRIDVWGPADGSSLTVQPSEPVMRVDSIAWDQVDTFADASVIGSRRSHVSMRRAMTNAIVFATDDKTRPDKYLHAQLFQGGVASAGECVVDVFVQWFAAVAAISPTLTVPAPGQALV